MGMRQSDINYSEIFHFYGKCHDGYVPNLTKIKPNSKFQHILKFYGNVEDNTFNITHSFKEVKH